jgi:signal peptidase II
MSASARFRLHASVFAVVLFLDQITKWWARARFSGPDGQPDATAFIPVLGDWFHLRLVYNYGAAFGTTPQSLVPFLNPTVFFVIFSLVAIACLGFYYYRLGAKENIARLGVLLILAGAVGNNLLDRPFFHKVTDFIDVGIPDVHPRFPVFNIADTAVTIGIILIFMAPLLTRKSLRSPSSTEASDA